MVDSAPSSDDSGRDRAESSGHPERTDPELVQAAIPDQGGIGEVETDSDVVASGSFILDAAAIASLLGTPPRDRSRYRSRTIRTTLTEADCYALSTLEDVGLADAQLDLVDRRNDIEGRKSYGLYLFSLVILWLFLVLATVCASGAAVRLPNWWPYNYVPILTEFELSETVLMALVGSTTVNVIGLLWVVIRYLFPRRDMASSGEQRQSRANRSQSVSQT